MPLVRALHTLRLGLKNVALHKLRSTLTVLGIVLGVASVIIMLAVGEAARFEAIRQIQQLGATNIIVRSVKPTQEAEQRTRRGLLRYGLTYEDLERILHTIPTVTSAVPLREFRKEIRYLDRKLEGRVVSVTPEFQELNRLKLTAGRFVSELDGERFSNVCVLGAETAELLFPLEDPIGRTVRIAGSHAFQVIGVVDRRSDSNMAGNAGAAQDYNRDVYIPFATDRARFGEILVYRRTGTFQFELLEISQITVAVDLMENVKQTAQIVQSLLDQYHTQKDTTITVPLDLLERAEETQRIFTLVLGAIASISLVVGGIGIMNIMLATLTERTREIGLRRAIGAKRRDITWQFLVESVVLSSTGGLFGVGLGIVASYGVTHFFELRTIIVPWSPLLAFAISVSVGLIFGTYPARRAAWLDPIEALRHE
jgi:putative ABC transport system permease protein